MTGMASAPSRLRQLLRLRALPGWIFSAWALLEGLHTGGYAIDLLDRGYKYFNSHTGVMYIVGLGWLFVVMLWPDLKKRFPTVHLPKSIHERVHDLHSSVAELTTLTAEGIVKPKELESHLDFVMQKVLGIERNVKETIETATEARAKIDGLQSWIDRAKVVQQLESHENRIGRCEGRIGKISLVIHKAIFHPVDSPNGLDITSEIQDMVTDDGTLRLKVDTAILGDPYPGRFKALTIDYSLYGRRAELVTTPEGRTLNIHL